MAAQEPIIALRGIRFGYPGAEPILAGLDFALGAAERVGILAPNGSGKTTLFLLIMGLLRPQGGEILVFGKPRRAEADFLEVRRRIGLVFQDPEDQLFCPTVIEDVAFGPLNLGRSRQEAVAVARRTLAALGLEAFEDRIGFQLSGGEKRLVSLAAVLAMEPEALLLDEPENGLDSRTRLRLVEVLEGLAIPQAIISHDIDLLTALCDRLLTLEAGRIREVNGEALHRHVHAHRLGDRPHRHSPAG